MLKLTRSVNDLVVEAEETVISLTPSEVMNRLSEPGLILIDLRDIRELKRDGRIPGSVHVPRGMLEFWVDPSSPYHKEVFASGKRLVFYCQSGWRSALATKAVQDMGLERVCHIGDGYRGWKDSGADTEDVEPRRR